MNLTRDTGPRQRPAGRRRDARQERANRLPGWVLLAALIAVSIAPAADADTTVPAPPVASASRIYRIGMIPWIAYSPLDVAQHCGFWRELGVAVEVVPCLTNPDLYRAIASGQVDLAIDMLGSAVGMHLDGVPVQILGETDWSHGGDKIIVKRNLDVARLKARPIGVYLAKPSVTFFLGRFLRGFGLRLQDVRVQELTMSELADAFIDGRFNVILNCDPEALRAQVDGDGRLAVTSADYAGVIPEGFVARTDKLAAIPRADLVLIFRGWIRAVRWLHDPANRVAWWRVLNTVTFKADGPFSEPDLLDMFRSVRIHPLPTQLRRNADPAGVRAWLTELRQFLHDNHLLSRDFTPDELLANQVLIEALRLESLAGPP